MMNHAFWLTQRLGIPEAEPRKKKGNDHSGNVSSARSRGGESKHHHVEMEEGGE